MLQKKLLEKVSERCGDSPDITKQNSYLSIKNQLDLNSISATTENPFFQYLFCRVECWKGWIK